jgi:predicted transcriptional regulator of viral defense system
MSLTSLVRKGYLSMIGKGEYVVVVPKVEEYLETLEFTYDYE